MTLKGDPLIPGLQVPSRGDLMQQRLCERHQLPQAVGDQLGLLGLGFGDTCNAGPDVQAATTGRQSEGERERGDDARDAAIVDVTNRMLAKRSGIPFLTLEDLHHQVCREGNVLLLIDCGSQLAATASLILTDDNCYVETLVVDRRFWGRGTSDALGRALTRLAHERGCRTLNGLAAKTNTAIQALMRRFGWEPVCETTRLRFWWPYYSAT